MENNTANQEEDVDQLVSLFTDTDYQEIKFEYKEFTQTIYALKTSATDYDLTGQIIWKAADILSKYLIDTLGPSQTFKDKSVLELGSGPGLCGLITQHFAKEVILSDYQDLVMDLIRQNIRDSRPNNVECQKYAVKLDWCMVEKDQNYFDQCEIQDQDGNVVRKLGETKLQYIIGSDIVYWTNSIKPLICVLNSQECPQGIA